MRPQRVEAPVKLIGLARRSLENLPVIAGGGDDLRGPVVRQAKRLCGGEVVAEKLIGPHVLASVRLGHVVLCNPQRLGLDQGADRPVDDKP